MGLIERIFFGEPICNLNITPRFKTPFGVDWNNLSDHGLMSLTVQYGLACIASKKLIEGEKHVSKKGYIFRDYVKYIQTKNLFLDINYANNICGLVALDLIIEKEICKDGVRKDYYFIPFNLPKGIALGYGSQHIIPEIYLNDEKGKSYTVKLNDSNRKLYIPQIVEEIIPKCSGGGAGI